MLRNCRERARGIRFEHRSGSVDVVLIVEASAAVVDKVIEPAEPELATVDARANLVDLTAVGIAGQLGVELLRVELETAMRAHDAVIAAPGPLHSVAMMDPARREPAIAALGQCQSDEARLVGLGRADERLDSTRTDDPPVRAIRCTRFLEPTTSSPPSNIHGAIKPAPPQTESRSRRAEDHH